MNNEQINKLYEDGIEQWRMSKGIGTAVIPAQINYMPFVFGILQRIYSRSPTSRVLVSTPTFEDRATLIELLTHQEDEKINEHIKTLLDKKLLRIYTESFAKAYVPQVPHLLTIFIQPTSFDVLLFSALERSRFKLVVLDKLPDANSMNLLNSKCPILPVFKANEVIAARASTPVEEMLIGVDITDEATKTKLGKCEEYINTSVTVFGSLAVLEKCRTGDATLNMSSAQMCSMIAEENGWSSNLDMSFPLNVQIDALYNPNALQERAKSTYEIIRTRSNILSDYMGKLDAILDIVKENIDKKILIINKRAEYASIVNDFLNNSLDRKRCLPYHDKLAPVALLDDAGKPILIKTGSHKGEQKIIAQKAQKTLNQKKFNMNEANILSTSSSPDKDLAIDVQVIIITSPKCNNIEDYIYRLSKVNYIDNSIKVYTLFCKDSVEEKLALQRTQSQSHRIVNKSENNIMFDENLGVIVC